MAANEETDVGAKRIGNILEMRSEEHIEKNCLTRSAQRLALHSRE